MTAEEFKIVLTRMVYRRVGARSLEAARLALVDGLTMQAVADRMRLNNRQVVFSAVCLAWKELEAHRAGRGAELVPTPPKVDESAPGVLRHFINGIRPKPMPRRMTAEEFERVRGLMMLRRRVGAGRLEAARLALVEGLSLQRVADRLKLSNRQLVYSVVRIAWEELQALRAEDARAETVLRRAPQRWWPWNGHAGPLPAGESPRT
ncbi:MAG: hypothetical protein ABIQ32_12735 [Sphingomicrobium sp.]